MDSQFKEAVFTIVRLIPKGRVSTYGAIAKAIGFPNHARHVGNVLGGCPGNVPAHRVVASNGILRVVSFQKKLETEGIVVTKMKIKNFKKLFWNPMLEL
ncbi:MAG: MGMT family protein [Bacteroidetes bacterium]|nr:MGMT family protein [Bacteroidota bacterium]